MRAGMKRIKGDNKGKVVLYALSTCQWCRKTKELLKDLNIDFYYVDVDLTEGEERKELLDDLEKYNPDRSFPTIVIDDSDYIIGFDEGKIKEKIKK
jgi:glutaredoxin-like protein NrdH